MDEEKWADPKREAGWQRVASAGTRPPPVAHVAILLSETLLHLQDVVNINGYLTKQMLSVGKLNDLHILHLLNIQSAHLPFFLKVLKHLQMYVSVMCLCPGLELLFAAYFLRCTSLLACVSLRWPLVCGGTMDRNSSSSLCTGLQKHDTVGTPCTFF